MFIWYNHTNMNTKGIHPMTRPVRIVVTIFAIAVFIFSGYKLLGIFSGYHAESEANQQLSDQFVQTQTAPTRPVDPPDAPTVPLPAGTTAPTEPPEYAPISVDFAALREMNPHVVGWIYCPDTPISYPIVQTENNADYLRQGLDGSYRHGGTIFLDFRCSGDFSDRNSIVYGHNLLDSTMFGTLERYQEQAYYEAHPVLYLLTPEADYRVELVAGLPVDAESAFYRTNHDADTYRDFLADILAGSDFRTAFPREEITRTLALSTCAYEYDDARYLVVGALIPLDRP